MSVSADGLHAVSASQDATLRVWEFDWNLDVPHPADWDDSALPFLETFLTLHTPLIGELPKDRQPTEMEIQQALTRRGRPRITKSDFQQLLKTLQHAGYGWLRPEGVKRKLLEMAAHWSGPPPLHE